MATSVKVCYFYQYVAVNRKKLKAILLEKSEIIVFHFLKNYSSSYSTVTFGLFLSFNLILLLSPQTVPFPIRCHTFKTQNSVIVTQL